MLPDGFHWSEWLGGLPALYLGETRCALLDPIPGGGCVLQWGVRECIPNTRVFPSAEAAKRFAEAWAVKWEQEIRQHLANREASGYRTRSPTPEESAEAARRDSARRSGRGRKDWWKRDAPPGNL